MSATVAAALALTLSLAAGPAVPRTAPPPESLQPQALHPYIPPSSAATDTPPPAEPRTETPKPQTPGSSATSSSAAPTPPKPATHKPKKVVHAPPATASTTAAPVTAAPPHPVTPAVQHPAVPTPLRPVAAATPLPAPAVRPHNGQPMPYVPTNPAPAQQAQSAPTSAPIQITHPAGASVPVTPITATTPISSDDIETFTDSVVRTLMQRDHVLGVTVAIVQGNTPVLLKGYGYDRLYPVPRRVDPGNSLFRIGSITKTFTWIVARQEIEAGRLKLNAPISGYLPADLYSEDRRYKPLTLYDLMDHASGYEDTSLGHLFELDPRHIIGGDSYFRLHRPRRVRDPGLFSSYSNFGPALAARIAVQTAQAKDVPSLMEARIFQPLGLDHTSLREPYEGSVIDLEGLPAPLSPALTQDLSDGFIWDGATYKAQPFEHAIPLAGALSGSSSAKDMARLMSLMLGDGQVDGVQLYNADSAKTFRTPMLTMPEGYNGWASGLMIRTAPSNHVTYGHAGATLWFNSNMILVPDLNLGIFISTNTQTGAPLANSFPNLLLDHLNGDLVRAPLAPTPEMAYAAHKTYYDSLKGQYVSTRRAYGGLEGAITRLVNTVEVSFDSDGRLILTTPNGLSAFVPTNAEGFFNQQDSEDPGPAAETGGLHFLMSADGSKVLGIETATNTQHYERVGLLHSPQILGVMTVIMLITCALVWVALLKGATRHERPTEAQTRATLVSCGLSLLWVIAILVFHSWQSGLDANPSALFTHWPSGQVRFASSLAVVAALGTLFQVITFYFVYDEGGRYSDGWAQWQKVSHGLMLLYWVFYIGVLGLWGALEPWSW